MELERSYAYAILSTSLEALPSVEKLYVGYSKKYKYVVSQKTNQYLLKVLERLCVHIILSTPLVTLQNTKKKKTNKQQHYYQWKIECVQKPM